jgi:AraC-like DNA-binding protein
MAVALEPTLPVQRQEHPRGWFEVVVRAPDPQLAGTVQGGYCAWTEWAREPWQRREVPSGIVPLILNLGPPLGVRAAGDRFGPLRPFGAFVAGLHQGPATTESRGTVRGVQINLTPLGAHRFLGLPMHELTNRVVELETLLGSRARRWVERLQEVPTWEGRFALLDRLLLERLQAARAPETSPELAWAWGLLRDRGGAVPIGELARELGWSHKRLIARFRQDLGLPPKALARVLRFHRAVRRLERSAPGSWAQVALDCGYYDQAHLIRDFGELAGVPPTELLRDRLIVDAAGEGDRFADGER